MTQAMFDAIRKIKGTGLTQADVDLFNAALGIATQTASRAGMKTSASGIALTHSFESLKFVSYKDPGSKDGNPITNGWGTTRDEDGGPIKLGVVWTREKADRLFARDLRDVEIGVNVALAGKPTTQAQFDALVCFTYNLGLRNLGESTLLRRHLAGDYVAARSEFARWNKNDGKVMAGLTRRRADEAALYGAKA